MRFGNAAFEFVAGRVEQLPPGDLPEIIFSGQLNVGRSSLVNKPTNRKALARVSAAPGKTDTINFYGLADCRLVNLPGYGCAKISQSEELRWANLAEGCFSAGRHVGLVVQIADMRHRPTADDLHMIDFLSAGGFPFVVAMTRSNKLNKRERTVQIQLYDDLFQDREQARHLPFSSTNGEGPDTLKEWTAAAYAVQEQRIPKREFDQCMFPTTYKSMSRDI